MSSSTENQEVLVHIQATPNPNAWKFILDRPVLLEGKAGFSSLEEATGNRLAQDLLLVAFVKQVHFFQNVITITARFDADAEKVQADVVSVIQTRMPIHNPSFGILDSKKARRADLPPEIQKIEEILDRTIRPGLQGDGGDLDIVKFENNRLYVAYQGACGTCPSATTGTLMAIEGILRDEFDPQIEVIPV